MYWLKSLKGSIGEIQLLSLTLSVAQFSIYKISKKKKQNKMASKGWVELETQEQTNILQPELWIKITQQVMHNPPASTQKHITLVLYGAIHSVMYMRCNVHCTAKSDTCSHFMAAHRNPGYCAYSTAMQFNTIGERIGMTGTEIAPTNNRVIKSHGKGSMNGYQVLLLKFP